MDGRARDPETGEYLDRQHWRPDGRVKITFATAKEAREIAQKLNDRAENHGFTTVEPYQCGICNGIHIGNRKAKLDEHYVGIYLDLDLELGERATWCALVENHGAISSRLWSIERRFLTAERRVLQQYPTPKKPRVLPPIGVAPS